MGQTPNISVVRSNIFSTKIHWITNMVFVGGGVLKYKIEKVQVRGWNFIC